MIAGLCFLTQKLALLACLWVQCHYSLPMWRPEGTETLWLPSPWRGHRTSANFPDNRRIDSFTDISTNAFGEKMREQVEERLRFYEEGVAPTKNLTAMQEALASVRAPEGGENVAPTDTTEKKKKKRKKSKEVTEELEEEGEGPLLPGSVPVTEQLKARQVF